MDRRAGQRKQTTRLLTECPLHCNKKRSKKLGSLNAYHCSEAKDSVKRNYSLNSLLARAFLYTVLVNTLKCIDKHERVLSEFIWSGVQV